MQINNIIKSEKNYSTFNNNLIKSNDLKALIQWTDEHICEKITIDKAAEIMHFNKNHFCKYFKQAVGISYINYVNQLKIQHAIELIKSGKSATECCFLCGFDNISYFIQLFKRITGLTTKEYIKKYAPKNNK